MSPRPSTVTLLVVGCLLPAIAYPQAAEIAGRVTDASGSALPDVRVTVSGAALLIPRATSTSPAGAYRVEAIPPGTYEIRFERDGFRGTEWRGLRIGAGLRATFDAQLQVEPRETIEPGSAWGAAVAVANRAAANRFRGRAWSSVIDHRLQSTNLTPALAAQGAGFGNPVRRVTEVGAEAGVPIWPNKAWLTGSADRTDSNSGVIGFYTPACTNADGTPAFGAALRVECLHADITRTEHATLRLQYQWSQAHRSTLTWGRSETRKPTRGASAYIRVEATTRQSDLGRAQPFQVQHHAIVSDRILFDAKYSFSDASFILDFQEPGLASVQGAYDRYTLARWRSAVQTEHRRPTTRAVMTGRYVVGGAGPARHEATLGLELLDRSSRRFDRTGGGAVAVFDSRTGPPLPYQARLVRDGETSHWERHWSVSVEDSYARGRLSIAAGVRLDVQDDGAGPASIPGSPLLPDLLPPVHFAGADSGVVSRDLSPRLAARWDPGREGRTVLGVGFAGSRAVGNTTSARLQPTGQTRLVYWWNDADGDGLVRREELDLVRGFAAPPTPNYDPALPSSVCTPARVDPRLRNVATEELTFGVERQLTRRLSLRANYVARWIHRLHGAYSVNDDGSPVGSGTFYPVSWAPPWCPAGALCPAVTFYDRTEPLPAGTLLRNDGRSGRHAGLDVVHKRQAQGWMLDVALRWSRARWFLPEPTRDYTDPTNVAMWDGTQYSMPGPRWSATLRGTVKLPWGFDAAAVFDARDGFPYSRVVTSPNRHALGSVNVLTRPFGSERYPGVRTLDCRLEHKRVLGGLAITPSLSVFNAANAGTVTRRNATQNSQAANAITRILPPRSIRLDLLASW